MLQVVVVKLLFLLWRFQPRGEVQTRVPASSGAEDLSSGGLCCRYINVDLSPAGCALCCSQPQSAQKCYRVCVCVRVFCFHFQSAAVRLFTVQLHSSLIFTGIQSSIYILSKDHLHVVFSDACVEMLETWERWRRTESSWPAFFFNFQTFPLWIIYNYSTVTLEQ